MTAPRPKREQTEAASESPEMLELLEDLLGHRVPGLPVRDVREPTKDVPALSGKDLLERPWCTLDAADREEQLALMEGYRQGRSHLHFVRTDSQPTMLRAVLRSLVPALVEDLLAEVGLDTPSARLLAEQAAEARAEEAYCRMLVGMELDRLQVSKAAQLEKMAGRHSKRMVQALEQLRRLRRPKVNVKIAQAGNVNLGTQQVDNRGVDTHAGDGEAPP